MTFYDLLMPQDPLAQMIKMADQLAMATFQGVQQLATLPLQMINSAAQGSGIFDAKMTTDQLVSKNIFGAGS